MSEKKLPLDESERQPPRLEDGANFLAEYIIYTLIKNNNLPFPEDIDKFLLRWHCSISKKSMLVTVTASRLDSENGKAETGDENNKPKPNFFETQVRPEHEKIQVIIEGEKPEWKKIDHAGKQYYEIIIELTQKNWHVYLTKN